VLWHCLCFFVPLSSFLAQQDLLVVHNPAVSDSSWQCPAWRTYLHSLCSLKLVRGLVIDTTDDKKTRETAAETRGSCDSVGLDLRTRRLIQATCVSTAVPVAFARGIGSAAAIKRYSSSTGSERHSASGNSSTGVSEMISTRDRR
jgi:hypothetical protein